MTKKKLPVRFTGQHFTIDKVLIKDAIRQANISNQDTVLDIGAGKGFLTVHLLKIANNVGNHSILRLDTHCSLTYLCSVIINDKDYGKRKSKLPGGVRPLSAVLRDQGPSGVLCGLWSELRQIHELAAPPAVERKAGEDGSGGTAQGSQGADNRQAQQQSYREDGSETAGR